MLTNPELFFHSPFPFPFHSTNQTLLSFFLKNATKHNQPAISIKNADPKLIAIWILNKATRQSKYSKPQQFLPVLHKHPQKKSSRKVKKIKNIKKTPKFFKGQFLLEIFFHSDDDGGGGNERGRCRGFWVRAEDSRGLWFKLTHLLQASPHPESRTTSTILLCRQLTCDDSFLWQQLAPATQTTSRGHGF